MCAGTPTTVEFGGTSESTTEPAPTREFSPTVMLPSRLALLPMKTPSQTVGWRLPCPLPVPPSVTPWYMVTSLPTMAVSPITTPVAWSMKSRRPKQRAGMNIDAGEEARHLREHARRQPQLARQSQWETR